MHSGVNTAYLVFLQCDGAMFHYDVSVFDFRLEKVSYTILLSSVILSFGFLEFLMEWVLKFFWKSMNRSILYFEVQWQKRTMHGTLGQFYFNIYLKCSILKLEKRLENFHLLLLVISQYLSGHFITFLNFKILLLLSISLEENVKSSIVYLPDLLHFLYFN